jgi:hypothetical protein
MLAEVAGSSLEPSPNRGSTLCGYCPYQSECGDDYGGAIV